MIDEERDTQGSLTYPVVSVSCKWRLADTAGTCYSTGVASTFGSQWPRMVGPLCGFFGFPRLARKQKWEEMVRLGPGHLKAPFLPP